MFCIRVDNNIGQKKGLCSHLYVVLWVLDCVQRIATLLKMCVNTNVINIFFSTNNIMQNSDGWLNVTILRNSHDCRQGEWWLNLKGRISDEKDYYMCLSLYPKNTNPISSEKWCFVLFAVIKAIHVVYCIGGILLEKKIVSGNGSKHEMWNQTMNKEEKVEACKTLTLKWAWSSIFALEAGAKACYFRNSLLPSKRFAQHKACMLNFLFKFFFPWYLVGT